jgi:hypothetical protein
MYTNVNYELIAAKQRDMLVQGEKDRRAREARHLARQPQPPASRARRSRRSWQLVRQLLLQSQS